ncbi:HAD-IIB family hydrolase [Streptococcus caprae]|uniref:HAD-IIB family hydrolase n=1 Tax=Streptococcus caprae TaxID=1640501 RepID=A0ABV8CY30_9STRE
MKFVFDLDGTLCFDGHHLHEEILAVLNQAANYGHEVVFASARSYRDCVGVLGESLKNNLVIALNGGLAYQNGHVIFARHLQEQAFHTALSWCRQYNLPFFVDDTFNYATEISHKMPFISTVDPLKIAEQIPVSQLTNPIKLVIYLGDYEELVEDICDDLESLGQLGVSYHAHEKCLYINPYETNKATTVEELIGEDFVTFGNDKNDKQLFKDALYAVQVGDYKPLTKYADEQILLTGSYETAIAAKILNLFAHFKVEHE